MHRHGDGPQQRPVCKLPSNHRPPFHVGGSVQRCTGCAVGQQAGYVGNLEADLEQWECEPHVDVLPPVPWVPGKPCVKPQERES